MSSRSAASAVVFELESLELEALDVELMELVELALSDALVAAEDDANEVEELESTAETRSVRNVVSAFDSCVKSESSCATVDDDELETVDALEALDDELDDCNAVRRLVRSVSSSDSRLLALDELSVEVEEVELLETPGGGPGGGPPTPPGRPWPWWSPVETTLAELWLLSDPPSCDRKASTVADRPTAVEASEDVTAALADAEVDALVLELSEELFWLAQFASSSRSNWACELKPETDIDMVCPQTSRQPLTTFR